MELGDSIPVLEDFFHITYVKNPGAAFGILQHQTGLFIAIAILVVLAVVYYYPRLPAGCRWLRIGLGLQLGGALGNLLDRMRFGYVIDFFDFRIWPVFNIADMAIVIGVGLLLWEILHMPADEKLGSGNE
jgi:signal peptidase II